MFTSTNVLIRNLAAAKLNQIVNTINNAIDAHSWKRAIRNGEPNQYEVNIPAGEIMDGSPMKVQIINGLSRQVKYLPLSNEFVINFGSNHEAEGLLPYKVSVGKYEAPVEEPTTEATKK